MRKRIHRNPSRETFMALATLPHITDWPVRGLWHRGTFYIWSGYDYTHQMACAELGIAFNMGAAVEGIEFEIYYSADDPTLGEHVQIKIKSSLGNEPPYWRTWSFLKGLT